MMIEPLSEPRLEAVFGIEEKDGDVHWSRSQFEKELKSEFIRFFVAVSSDVLRPPAGEAGPTSDVERRTEVLGYGGYWKAGDEAQITNLVVRKEARCQGVGRRLVEFILDCARSEACTTSTLEVRASNAHAQSLYRHLGYEVKGTRKKIYQNPEEDAVLMEKKL